MMLRGFRDRDQLLTREGLFFTVVGNLHPEDRIISYLKYIPNPGGKWGRGKSRYARMLQYYTIPSLLDTIRYLEEKYRHYVWFSEELGIKMSAVPKEYVQRHYKPEEKLSELLNARRRDRLEEAVVNLVGLISDESGVATTAFGVTGSILVGIHNVKFSDIDLTVYGVSNSLKVKEALTKIYDDSEKPVKRLPPGKLQYLLNRRMRLYHLSREDAELICLRRWNRGVFGSIDFSIHPVKLEEEEKLRFGDYRFKPKGIVTVEAIVTDTSEAMFMPCTYRIEPTRVLEGEAGPDLTTVTSFEGLYADIALEGEAIRVRGKLEAVIDRKGRIMHHRVLVGSPEAEGYDYIVVVKS
ncbi:MAG: hypothetical protein QXK12_05915 [Candidatus Nezhaarchaeales archaeon]